MDTWAAVAADRRSFAEYLATLEQHDWEARSLCDEWTVQGVVAHLLVPPTMSKGQVFRAFAGSGFNLDKMSAKLIARMSSTMSASQMAAKVAETAGVQSAPPGLKPVGVFAELLVHAADVSMAIGKPFAFPVDHYVVGLDHMKDVQPVLGCKKRIAGLRLQATDATWSTGAGPLVEGDAQHLLAAMTGRRRALDSLTGDGVAVLRTR